MRSYQHDYQPWIPPGARPVMVPRRSARRRRIVPAWLARILTGEAPQ